MLLKEVDEVSGVCGLLKPAAHPEPAKRVALSLSTGFCARPPCRPLVPNLAPGGARLETAGNSPIFRRGHWPRRENS